MSNMRRETDLVNGVETDDFLNRMEREGYDRERVRSDLANQKAKGEMYETKGVLRET